MSLISKICPVILGTGALVGLTVSSVKAADLTLTDDAPNSGSVTLDNNDKVISASSDYLRDLANKKQDGDDGLSNRGAWNMANSRWVFYTEGHNYFNNYKRSHSNYLHFKEFHGSYAAVGKSRGKWAYANAGRWSIATKGGHGTAIAKYFAPYN